jgi:glycosyltransferase involved in cell wall biosynthesis
MTLELAVVCDSFSMGGTAKAAVTYALHHDRDRVRPRAIALSEPGARADELEAAGIEVLCARGDPATLAEQLRGAEIVHVHRSGLAEPLVPDACRAAGVGALVETNVFGFKDTSSDSAQFAAHLFISQMCAMRYRAWEGLELDAFYARHRTMYYPVDVEGLRTASVPPGQAREQLGLDPERPTVVRVGRDDDRKWGDIVVTMVPELVRLVPDVQILFVGTTPHRRRQLERLGVLGRVRCEPPSSEPGRLAAFYGAADVFASASSIGESFGLALAEAMALGVPVVTNSTPWTDNAQVEVVDNGLNGWVANHPRVFAEAVSDLLGDRLRRRVFGEAARVKVEASWHPEPLTRQLEDLFEALAASGSLPPAWTPGIGQEREFEDEYPRRCESQYRSPSGAEQREAARAVRRERAHWALHDLRSSPLRGGWRLLRLALGRLRARLRRQRS